MRVFRSCHERCVFVAFETRFAIFALFLFSQLWSYYYPLKPEKYPYTQF